MLRTLRVALLGSVLLNGCAADHSAALGFVNRTQHSEAQLWTLWQAAQRSLSQQIDLNPLQRLLETVPPQMLPGDARVWKLSPHQLVVSPQSDVSSAALYAATGMQRGSPTGLIGCPQPCNVRFAPAYSFYSPPVSRYAASWEFSGSNFDVLVQYEFENQILSALGYDMRWR
jgi:hypothetical protein